MPKYDINFIKGHLKHQDVRFLQNLDTMFAVKNYFKENPDETFIIRPSNLDGHVAVSRKDSEGNISHFDFKALKKTGSSFEFYYLKDHYTQKYAEYPIYGSLKETFITANPFDLASLEQESDYSQKLDWLEQFAPEDQQWLKQNCKFFREPIQEKNTNRIDNDIYEKARTKLHQACDRYLAHNKKELKEFSVPLSFLESALNTVNTFIKDANIKKPQALEHANYMYSENDPVSTQLYMKLEELKALSQFLSKNIQSKHKTVDADKFCHQTANRYPKMLGYIKSIAVLEINKILSNEMLDATTAIKQCEEQLNRGKTLEILLKDRQSQGEHILKILSVVGILAGVGIFTTLGLMMKRLYDTGGTSLNFFKPLTQNLYEDVTNITYPITHKK